MQNNTGRAVHVAALFVCFGLLMIIMAAECSLVAHARAELRREPLVLLTSTGKRIVNIEIAETRREKSRGLMYRTSLPDDRGMLFVYRPAQKITMWMKNTYISLDMVFISATGIVQSIAANREPLSEDITASQGPASFVLELKGGAAARLGLQAGDKLRHRLFNSP